MCLKKSVLKQLLADYPDASKYYKDRAWERRKEFRKIMKRHVLKNDGTEKREETEEEEEDSTFSSDFSEDEDEGGDGGETGVYGGKKGK